MKDKKKIIIVSVLVIVVAALGIIYAAQKNKSNTDTNSGETKTETSVNEQENAASGEVKADTSADDKPQNIEPASEEDEKVYTPTFMYFISESDDNFEATNKMLENFQKEYKGKINFDIKNIDKDPKAAENFPVKGQTPALIMLNSKNDICAFLFQCADEKQLRDEIEKTLK